MNAELAIREMELAAWEMAEAETCDRKAHKLRLDATKRIAAVHIELKASLTAHKQRHTPKPTKQTA